MKYAIIGSGKIGTALARTFARKNIEVAVANSRGPGTLGLKFCATRTGKVIERKRESWVRTRIGGLAPQVGLKPTTLRLTAGGLHRKPALS